MNPKTSKTWNRLDNAAKIFPPTSTRRDPKVFRFSCRLTEEVEPDVLQKALDGAIREFPGFCCILKRGAFWYYLEESPLRPKVREETEPPCSTLYKNSVSGDILPAAYRAGGISRADGRHRRNPIP